MSLSYEEFCIRVNEKHGEGEYEIRDFNGLVNECTIKHRCGEEWTAVSRTMLRGKAKCPICFSSGGKHGKTHKRFLKEVKELFNGEIEVVGGYEHSQKTIRVKHHCGYEYPVIPSNLLNKKLNKNICVKCYNRYKGRKTNALSNETFLKRFSDIDVHNEFELLSGYETSNKEVIILHKNCGHIDLYFPNTFLDKRVKERCKNCKPNKVVTRRYFEEIFSPYSGEFELVDYTGFSKTLTVKHMDCGKILNFSRAQHFKGCCIFCDETLGERRVRETLEGMGLEFEKEYSRLNIIGVAGCPLKLDFYLEWNSQKVVIEYDGIFHFEKKHENDGHENLILNDKIKDDFCRKNEIKMIRIPYWEYENIKKILLKELEAER